MSDALTDGSEVLHASCVAVDGRGVLILGPSGAGKSALALALMALGAQLVADDRTIVTPVADGLVASCPETLLGLIEARGLGILRADPAGPVPLVLAVDLSTAEASRLPPFRSVTFAGRSITLVQSQQNPHFPASLLQYVKGGRHA